MKTHLNAWIAGTAVIAALSLGGCATEEFVKKQVAEVDQKTAATQGQVDALKGQVSAEDAAQNAKNAAQDAKLNADDVKLGELDRTSRDALSRAQAAGKLAEGKFVYALVLQDDGVKFKSGKTSLTPEGEARLVEFAGKLKADNKNVYLEIQGHTDNRGSKAGNKRIGDERAEAVRLFLNKQGVALSRMSTISYGGDAPVAPNKTRDGRAQNRRVVIVVLS